MAAHKLKMMLLKILRGNLKMINPFMKFYLEKKKGAWGVVYMLHRVEQHNPVGLPSNEELTVDPDFLDSLIKEYKAKGFVFLSIGELAQLMKDGVKPDHPFVVFTCDDGYLDNYTKAYPVFKANNVPFCIYVTTDFPDRKAFLWWYALEDYLQDREEARLSDGDYYSLKTFEEKETAFQEIRKKILKFPKQGFAESFKSLLIGFDKDIYSYVNKLSMSWKQIQELSNEPLCTIGSHTVHHFALTQLCDDEIRYEIETGDRILSEKLNQKITHFSYPHGLAYERERSIVERYGYESIVSCISEVVRPIDKAVFIPRVLLRDK